MRIVPKSSAGARARGRAVAAVLAGSWRSSPPPIALDVERLAEAGPYLLRTGAGGLGWRRTQDCAFRQTSAVWDLRQAYRLHTLQVAQHQVHLEKVLARLRAAGVEPILVKGWSVIRLYPEIGLRPCGDIDLCVCRTDFVAAKRVLAEAAGSVGFIDLHRELADLDDRTWGEVFRRSRLVPLGAGDVRVLGPEDQLRQVCLHLIRHGA